MYTAPSPIPFSTPSQSHSINPPSILTSSNHHSLPTHKLFSSTFFPHPLTLTSYFHLSNTFYNPYSPFYPLLHSNHSSFIFPNPSLTNTPLSPSPLNNFYMSLITLFLLTQTSSPTLRDYLPFLYPFHTLTFNLHSQPSPSSFLNYLLSNFPHPSPPTPSTILPQSSSTHSPKSFLNLTTNPTPSLLLSTSPSNPTFL
jgi:hypothetical protein